MEKLEKERQRKEEEKLILSKDLEKIKKDEIKKQKKEEKEKLKEAQKPLPEGPEPFVMPRKVKNLRDAQRLKQWLKSNPVKDDDDK